MNDDDFNKGLFFLSTKEKVNLLFHELFRTKKIKLFKTKLENGYSVFAAYREVFKM